MNTLQRGGVGIEGHQQLRSQWCPEIAKTCPVDLSLTFLILIYKGSIGLQGVILVIYPRIQDGTTWKINLFILLRRQISGVFMRLTASISFLLMFVEESDRFW